MVKPNETPPGGGATDGGGTPDPSQEPSGGQDDKRFTQKDLDRFLGSRLKEELAGRVKLEDLGVESEDALKKALQQAQEAEDARKSEHDKALEQARKDGRKEAESEIMGKANARLIRSEFIAAAQAKGVIKPQDLYLVLKGEERLKDLKVTDSDEVEGLDDAFWEEALKDREYLLTQAPGAGETPPAPPGKVNAGTGPSTKTPSDERQTVLRDKYPALSKGR